MVNITVVSIKIYINLLCSFNTTHELEETDRQWIDK